jgi:hypothetical protein
LSDKEHPKAGQPSAQDAICKRRSIRAARNSVENLSEAIQAND